MSGDVRRSINKIAQSGITGLDGMPVGTEKIYGYVCNINRDGDYAGTIDVQEYGYEPGEYATPGVGHHKGVLLSAIQINDSGFLIEPMLFSDVVIVRNPSDDKEYVLMYSHARRLLLKTDAIQGENDSQIEIGVTEVEKFVSTDEGLDKDYDELEPTKNYSKTTYGPTSISDQIASPNDEDGLKQEKTAEHKIITVGDTKITIDGQNVTIETSGKVAFKIGSTELTQEDGSVSIKTDNAKIESANCEIKGNNVKIDGASVTITGGTLTTQGVAGVDMNGPFNAIKVCPFSGAPHCGSTVSGT